MFEHRGRRERPRNAREAAAGVAAASAQEKPFDRRCIARALRRGSYQELVECVEESELGRVGDLVGRGDPSGRGAAVVVHAPARLALGCLALRLSSASRSR